MEQSTATNVAAFAIAAMGLVGVLAAGQKSAMAAGRTAGMGSAGIRRAEGPPATPNRKDIRATRPAKLRFH